MKKIRQFLLLTVLWAGAANAQTFNDVATDHWAYNFIEILAANGITTGCGNNNYCPQNSVNRAQMAVFLERGMNGSDFSPPAATGNVFLDVDAEAFAANFIEQLFSDGITNGCGNNNYCPNAEVSRSQMAVFLLRAKYGSGYSPPAATGVFNDVDLSYWAVHWIEALAAEGITAGCGNGNYCPEDSVTRAQMAVFLVRTFGLIPPPPDSDGDGTPDAEDAFPLDPGEQTDTDGDGTGNNADSDDDNDGATDDFEVSCGTDPLDPDDTAYDTNNNGECDATETTELGDIGITPRFVRFSDFSGTLFDVRANAVGVGVASDEVIPVIDYWTHWMSGGSGSIVRVELNDDMLNGDEVADDFDFRWKGFFSDVVMPASTIFADNAFNFHRVTFSLRDQSGNFVSPGRSLDVGLEVGLIRDDIPSVTVNDIAPGVRATNNTAFLSYDGGLSAVGEQQVAQDFFTYFEDVNILAISSYESTTGNGNPDAGVISNDVGGIVLNIFDASSAWGSDGALQLFIRMKDNMGWVVPHEVGHRWGFYANNPIGISTPRGSGYHIALSSLQGQMAASGFLEEQVSGDFLWTSDDGDGNYTHRPFSEWMQYLACDIPKEDVSPMWIINPDFEDLYSFFDTIPRAHMTEVTIADFIAANGERSVIGDQCQTVFTVGFVVVNRARNPLTPDDFTGYTEQHSYLLGNSPGLGEILGGGVFDRPDMISLNATMSAGKITFTNGLARRSSSATSSKTLGSVEGVQNVQIDEESIIWIEEPIPEPLDFSGPGVSSIPGEVH